MVVSEIARNERNMFVTAKLYVCCLGRLVMIVGRKPNCRSTSSLPPQTAALGRSNLDNLVCALIVLLAG
jgi:hypothetical protein